VRATFAAANAVAGENDHVTQRAAIYSAPDAPAYGFIEFSEPHGGLENGSFGCTFTLSLAEDESSVGIGEMIEVYASDTLGFFEELAREASGWEKPKVWRSEFAEVAITASHTGDRVELGVLMRWPALYEEERTGVLRVLPDDLPRLAEQMRGLMRKEHGRRMWHPGNPPPDIGPSVS
jgi:hypothetical protein